MDNAQTISTFYKFTPLAAPRDLREQVKRDMLARNIKGTITLAPEGINATICGEPHDLNDMIECLQAMPEIGEFTHKESHFGLAPFQRSKVKVKKELISLGTEADPSVCVGEYVGAERWNEIIAQPDVITIDTRNDYEYRIGHFEGAVNPATRDFKEMVAFTAEHLDPKHTPRVAMYCTGGIRCEKYSSYLVSLGFEHVYHLHGGILQYLADMPENKSLWRGACYVFDERVAVNHDLSPAAHITMCGPCGAPLEPHDREASNYIEGLHCPYCLT